jgi:hypothetical protein
MRQRGRPSGNSLSIVPAVPVPDGRPEPPAILSEAEAREWRRYTAALPSTWFTPENLPLLTELCQAIELSNSVAQELHRIKSLRNDDKLAKFLKLVRAKVQVSETIFRLSTKLRFTPQSRLTAQRAAALAETARFPRPWDLVDSSRADEPADKPATDWGPGSPRKN